MTLDRIESGRYTVRNQRGGEITVGSGNTTDFTPVELLLAALAGCSAIDLDLIVSKRSVPLEFSAVASGLKVRDELGNRLTDLGVEFRLEFAPDASGAEAWSVVPRSLDQIVSRLCTVSRTVAVGTPVRLRAEGSP